MAHDDPFLSPDLFVGRRSQLAELGGLARQGQSILLVGGRRAGKSTLVRQLRAESVSRSLVHADASGWDLSTERSALGGLRSAIEDRPQTAYLEATRDEVVTALQQIRPLVLVVDEADRVLRTAWCSGFFSFLRYLDDTLLRSHISIVLVGGPVLMLFRDPEERGSPPLNTAHPIFLDPLDDPAVDQLIGLAPRTVLDRADLMRLGGGHAFLTTRLLSGIWTGQSLAQSAESVFDRYQATFESWERQLGPDGRDLYRRLPAGGVAMESFLSGTWRRFQRAQRFARSIGVVQVIDGRVCTGTSLFRQWMSNRDPGALCWEVALAYAAEDEVLARSVAVRLRPHIGTFFAPDEQAFLWAPDTVTPLPHTFEVECRRYVVICTPAYVGRHWAANGSDEDIEEIGRGVVFLDCGARPPTARRYPMVENWDRLSGPELAEAILTAVPLDGTRIG